MKYGLFCLLTLCLIFGAYQAAQNKIESPLAISSLKLGMDLEQLEEAFGTPSAQSRNQLTYILNDGSELFITLREDVVSSAKVKFHRTIKIQDPDMKKLTLVQMDSHNLDNNPSWFFAGNPAEGLIYKITNEGTIESLTWVPPFTYGANRPKQVQALLRDFQTQKLSNL